MCTKILFTSLINGELVRSYTVSKKNSIRDIDVNLQIDVWLVYYMVERIINCLSYKSYLHVYEQESFALLSVI